MTSRAMHYDAMHLSSLPQSIISQHWKTWVVNSPVKETNLLHYPLDRDLSDGWGYPPFQQLGSEEETNGNFSQI